MSALRKGQNTGVDALRVVVTVDPALELSALLVDTDRRARSSAHLLTGEHVDGTGVRCSVFGLEIDTHAVSPTVDAVLCVVACEPGHAPTATVRDGRGAVLATYTAADLTTERAVVLVELYRRGGGWKVRAVGQGYDGGLAAAAADHGITLAAPVAAPVGPGADGLGAEEVVRRVRGIWEDAARSTAAYLSACTFAEERREREVAATLADAARRTDPAAEHERVAAHTRHDELVARADAEHERDVAQLVAETAGLEQALPAPVAGWDAPGWRGPAGRFGAVRLGSVHTDLAPQLVLPLVAGLPLPAPLWVDGEPGAAAPVLRALVLRLLAAHPPGALTLHAVDLVGGLDLGRPVALGVVLTELLHTVDLARMAAGVGQPPPGEHLLVLHGLPHGLGEETLHQLRAVVAAGGAHGVQVLVSGAGADLLGRHTDRALATMAEGMQRIPVALDGTLADPWTGGEWAFTPDAGPSSERVAALLRLFTATT